MKISRPKLGNVKSGFKPLTMGGENQAHTPPAKSPRAGSSPSRFGTGPKATGHPVNRGKKRY